MSADEGFTLYVAGPMTGLPEYNVPAFFAAEERLTEAGFTVLNPARHGVDPAKTWADYMRLGLRDVLDADGVALLPGWQSSKGALLEADVADRLGMHLKPVEDWLLILSLLDKAIDGGPR